MPLSMAQAFSELPADDAVKNPKASRKFQSWLFVSLALPVSSGNARHVAFSAHMSLLQRQLMRLLLCYFMHLRFP
jgi:hypothetical protein